MNDSFWQAAYIIAALCVVLSIKWLSSPVTARRGVLCGRNRNAAGGRRHAAASRSGQL